MMRLVFVDVLSLVAFLDVSLCLSWRLKMMAGWRQVGNLTLVGWTLHVMVGWRQDYDGLSEIGRLVAFDGGIIK